MATAEAAPKSGGKMKLILMIVVAVLLLGGVGLGALIYMNKQKAAAEADDGGSADAAPVKHTAKKKPAAGEKPVFVPMDPFVVNLADHDADRYAQIGVVLQVTDEHESEDIKAYMPAIRNNILMLLSHKASTDLASADGKELLARQIRRESLRAMGEDVGDDDDDADADSDTAADSAAAPAKKKKKRRQSIPADAPILSVQFSSFIIQ